MSQKSDRQKKKSAANKAAAEDKRNIKAAVKEVEDNPPEAQFELIIGDVDNEDGDDFNVIDNADLPVRWCITEELIEALTEAGIQDPHLLICTTPEGTSDEMSRRLLPLTELMTYMRCTKAGKVTIHAWILDGKRGRKHLHEKYLQKINNGYETDIISRYDGQAYDNHTEFAQYTAVDVNIPEGVFGKEPGPKMKFFVNYWHKGNLQDECNYRQRLIVACLFKWELMFIYGFINLMFRSTLAVITALVGYRKNVIWKQLPEVFTWNMLEIEHLFQNKYDNWFFDNDYMLRFKKPYEDWPLDKITVMTTMLFNPLILLMVFIGCLLFIGHDDFGLVAIYMGIVLTLLVKIVGAVDIAWNLFVHSLREDIWHNLGKFFGISKDTLVTIWEWQNKIIFKALVGLCIAIIGYMIVMLAIAFWLYTMWVLYSVGLMLFVTGVAFGSMWLIEKWMTISPEKNDMRAVRELLCKECDTAVKPRKANIPTSQRTIKLWYLETKNKVCKPMQR